MTSQDGGESLDVGAHASNDRGGSQSRASPSPSGDMGQARAAKRTRGRSGCLNCRRRRKKCDEKKPVCSKCHTRGESCEWATGIIFRNQGIGTTFCSSTTEQLGKSGSVQNALRIIDLENLNPTKRKRQVDNEVYASSEDSRNQPSSTSQQPDPWIWHSSYPEANSLKPNQHIQRPVTGTNTYGVPRPDSHLVNGEVTTSSSQVAEEFPPLSIHAFDYTGPINAVGQSPRDLSRDIVMKQHAAPISATSPSLLEEDESNVVPGTGTIDAILNAAEGLERGMSVKFQHPSDSYLPFNAADLEALDYLITNPTHATFLSTTMDRDEGLTWSPEQSHEAFPDNQVMAESPDTYTMYYPNPAYKELHTVLHNYMVSTARATGLTRQATPTESSETTSTEINKTSIQADVRKQPIFQDATHRLSGAPKNAELTKRRELELWQNYLDEIAVWLDMFDVERHFQLTIPMMAKSAEHLRYSILALSARQQERKDPNNPYTESLTLYQKAIELIVRELHSLETAVIASCVLLCVLEMMSSSPKAWAKHLDGCSMLLQAAGISGTIGGDRQALFWCFARMDVWGGFLSDTLTKIPTSSWITPSQSMPMAVAQFKTGSGGFDNYANYAVFLCASVINLLSNPGPGSSRAGRKETASNTKGSTSTAWKALYDLLEDWYNSRPVEMRPLMSSPADVDDHQHPFPIVLFSISPAVNGNQLYHASSLLMLQEKPKDVRLPRGHKSIQWHARQICGIAESNHSHGAWINALQPLWIAGKVMSHPIEHRIILDLLARIEKETGWATSWRAEDLKDYWGDTEE